MMDEVAPEGSVPSLVVEAPMRVRVRLSMTSGLALFSVSAPPMVMLGAVPPTPSRVPPLRVVVVAVSTRAAPLEICMVPVLVKLAPPVYKMPLVTLNVPLLVSVPAARESEVPARVRLPWLPNVVGLIVPLVPAA